MWSAGGFVAERSVARVRMAGSLIVCWLALGCDHTPTTAPSDTVRPTIPSGQAVVWTPEQQGLRLGMAVAGHVVQMCLENVSDAPLSVVRLDAAFELHLLGEREYDLPLGDDDLENIPPYGVRELTARESLCKTAAMGSAEGLPVSTVMFHPQPGTYTLSATYRAPEPDDGERWWGRLETTPTVLVVEPR